jgi:hypothetical protein
MCDTAILQIYSVVEHYIEIMLNDYPMTEKTKRKSLNSGQNGVRCGAFLFCTSICD